MGEVVSGSLVDHVMTVAASRSPAELGAQCHAAAHSVIGSPTLGLYLCRGTASALVYSHDVPAGFLDEYARHLCACDPLLDMVRQRRHAVAGAELAGREAPNLRAMRDLLGDWGFAENLCGPIYIDRDLAGFIYTADRLAPRADPALRAGRLDYICRSAAIALRRMEQPAAPPQAERARPQSSQAQNLPPRLAAVARLVCEGRTNKEIARRLDISHHTVKEHVAALCTRLAVRNRTGIAAALTRRAEAAAGLVPGFHDLPVSCDYF